MKEKLAVLYAAQLVTPEPFTPSHNVAPTESVPIVIEDAVRGREIAVASFGIPTTVKGRSFSLLNIQSERAANRNDFMTRRCIVPAAGFFEWEKRSPKDKQPYYFSPQDGVFSFAGLWRLSGAALSFTILTTHANELVGAVHGRMPVILGHNAIAVWLSPQTPADTLTALMEPYPAGLMQSWKVSKAVNSPKNKKPACINSL